MNIRVPVIATSEPQFWKDMKAWCGNVARRLNQVDDRIKTIAAKPPKPHPHQLLKTFDPTIVSDTVAWKCRSGYVYVNGTAYAMTGHVANSLFDVVTDTGGKLDDPDTYPVVSVYAMINESTGAWVYDTDSTKEAYSGRTAIEIARKEGIKIRQKMHSHIIIGDVGTSQLDHSFRPTQLTATTFDIIQGVVYMADETPVSLPTTATNISFATNTHFQVKIDISSVAPVATWEAGVAFTANTATALYFPVLEFGTAGDFSTLIRRQTNDIHYHVGEGGFDVRGTPELYKVVALRAYLTADDTLVAVGTAFNGATMYLHQTWDWERWP